MSVISEITNKDLIVINNETTNYEEFFLESYKHLLEKGFVQESFFEAILSREKKYPTGLELPKITIAIPHTDVEHIIKPFIFINKMKKREIEFIQMGTDDIIVKPEFIIILGIKEKTGQVGLLSEMMSLFDNDDFINKLKVVEDIDSMYKLFIEQ